MSEQLRKINDMIIGAAGMIGTNLRESFTSGNLYLTDIWLTNLMMEHNTKNINRDDIRTGMPIYIENDEIEIERVWFLAALCTSYGMCQKPFTTFEITMSGLLSVADYYRKIGKIIYTSSSEVYNQTLGDESGITIPPMNRRKGYGWGKLAGEILLKTLQEEKGTKYNIFRLFNVYGPYEWRDAVIPKFIL